MPKANGYQALHTVVMTFDGVPMEVQIQSSAMETFANYGIASHGLYKTNVSDDLIQAKSRQLVQRLTEMSKSSSSSQEFLQNLKTDLKGKEVYVFSPNGRIFSLNQGATPIDFAYAIHNELGNYCLSCEIDKKLSPVTTILESGQTIEIIKGKKKTVNPDWLNYVVTPKAIHSIKRQLKNMRLADLRVLGKDLLENSLEDAGIELKEYPDENLKGVFKLLGVRNLNQLLVDIGSGKRTSNIVLQSFAEGLRGFKRQAEITSKIKIGSSKKYGAISFPECCYPVSGDPCLAVHNELGISVHRNGCKNLKFLINKQGSCSDVIWEQDPDAEFTSTLKLTLKNEPGVLAEISKIISQNDSNIQGVATQQLDENFIELNIKYTVKNTKHLSKITNLLKKNKTVTEVKRRMA